MSTLLLNPRKKWMQELKPGDLVGIYQNWHMIRPIILRRVIFAPVQSLLWEGPAYPGTIDLPVHIYFVVATHIPWDAKGGATKMYKEYAKGPSLHARMLPYPVELLTPQMQIDLVETRKKINEHKSNR